MNEADDSEGFEILEIIREVLDCRFFWVPPLLVAYMCLSLWLIFAVHPIVGFALPALLIVFLVKEHKKAIENPDKLIHNLSERSGFRWNVEESFDDYERLLEKKEDE